MTAPTPADTPLRARLGSHGKAIHALNDDAFGAVRARIMVPFSRMSLCGLLYDQARPTTEEVTCGECRRRMRDGR